jgi:hypothetical protein
LPSELTTPPVTKMCLVTPASSFPSARNVDLRQGGPPPLADRIEPAAGGTVNRPPCTAPITATVPVTGPPTGCRRPAVDAGLDPWRQSGVRARICWAAVAIEGSSSASSAACRARPASPQTSFLGSSGIAAAGRWRQACRHHPDLQQDMLH